MEPEQAIELVYAFLEQFIDLDDIPPEFVLNGDPTAIASILWFVVVIVIVINTTRAQPWPNLALIPVTSPPQGGVCVFLVAHSLQRCIAGGVP